MRDIEPGRRPALQFMGRRRMTMTMRTPWISYFDN